jgi:hypothetical protein
VRLCPSAILHENRYLTDLRTGAAGAVAVKHLAVEGAKSVAFIGTGAIAEVMARSAACIYGKAVQIDPIKRTLKAPGTERLKLTYDKVLSSFAFEFNMRRYTTASRRASRSPPPWPSPPCSAIR